MKYIPRFFASIPMAFLWMIMAKQFTIEGFIVGYVVGFGVLVIIRATTTQGDEIYKPFSLMQLPKRIWSFIVYILDLALAVLISGTQVAFIAINPKNLNEIIEPGVQKVSTQDPSKNIILSALSAHSITITPGELVIDFEIDEHGETVMLVHSLNMKASSQEKLNSDQTERLARIKEVMGYE